MDRTEKFKEMCQQAGLDWDPKVGMWLWDKRNNCLVLIATIEYGFKGCLKSPVDCLLLFKENGEYQNICKKDYSEDFFPIWTQDQLQEMVSESGARTFGLLEKLHNWWVLPKNQVGYCDSLEQLWLAYVMDEKWAKAWDDKDKKWRTIEK